MGKGQGSGNAWYAIKNVVGALLFIGVAVFAGPLAGFIGGAALFVLGVVTILYALARIGETAFIGTVVEIVIGVGIIIASKWLMELAVFVGITQCLTGVIIAFIGWSLRVKRRDRYAVGTPSEKSHKTVASLLTFFITGGGVVIVAGNVIGFIAPHISQLSYISTAGVAMCVLGMIFWIVYTIMVLKVLKKTGMTINDYKTKRSKKGGGSSGSSSSAPQVTQSRSSGGASESKVRSEMNSVANYFSGGWDYVGSKAQIKYSVSVSVSGGVIDFMLSCRLDGQVTQAEFDSAKNKVNSLIEKKQKAIMDRAMNRLNAIGPDRDYSVGVDVSTQ